MMQCIKRTSSLIPLVFDSIHFLYSHGSIQGYIWPMIYIRIYHLQAPNLKFKQETIRFLGIYLLLKLRQLLRLHSRVIIGGTLQTGAPCVAWIILIVP